MEQKGEETAYKTMHVYKDVTTRCEIHALDRDCNE